MADPLLEEEYEKYVFEMEEQGLQPMSFEEFERQARSGMNEGGGAQLVKNNADGSRPGYRGEAAAASARLGVDTALFTHNINTIGEMYCNTSIGGLGKGHLVKEIDALDGVMGVVADKSGIQFRLLNRSRGPAVRGPRTQSDRALYKKYMQETLLSYCNLRVFSDPVIEFIFDKNQVVGFHTKSGKKINCKKMILTTGTFLNGLIHIGDERTPAGRHNEKPSTGLSE